MRQIDRGIVSIEIHREEQRSVSIPPGIKTSIAWENNSFRSQFRINHHSRIINLFIFLFQTKDLLAVGNSSKQPYLNAFKSILREQIKPLMQEITGIALNDDIDLFCGQYATTDYLLCHDDELEGARIAVMRVIIFRCVLASL